MRRAANLFIYGLNGPNLLPSFINALTSFLFNPPINVSTIMYIKAPIKAKNAMYTNANILAMEI